MREEGWVVLRAVHPSWCTAQLPGEVADLLRCRAEELERLQKPGRAIAFLDRGPGTLRVIGTHRSADLLAKEMAANRVVGISQLTQKLVFNLPDDVERHLGITTYPRGEHGARGTDDTLLWFLPSEEYYAYREATRGEGEFHPPPAGPVPHLYLAKSLLANLRPPLSELERSGGSTARTAPISARARRSPMLQS